VSSLELQELRRIVGAVARLRGESVRHASAKQQIDVRFD